MQAHQLAAIFAAAFLQRFRLTERFLQGSFLLRDIVDVLRGRLRQIAHKGRRLMIVGGTFMDDPREPRKERIDLFQPTVVPCAVLRECLILKRCDFYTAHILQRPKKFALILPHCQQVDALHFNDCHAARPFHRSR